MITNQFFPDEGFCEIQNFSGIFWICFPYVFTIWPFQLTTQFRHTSNFGQMVSV